MNIYLRKIKWSSSPEAIDVNFRLLKINSWHVFIRVCQYYLFHKKRKNPLLILIAIQKQQSSFKPLYLPHLLIPNVTFSRFLYVYTINIPNRRSNLSLNFRQTPNKITWRGCCYCHCCFFFPTFSPMVFSFHPIPMSTMWRYRRHYPIAFVNVSVCMLASSSTFVSLRT